MAHTTEDRDGMKVLVVTHMQNSSTMESGEQKIIEHKPLEEPVEIVHYTEISKFYNIDARDVWPLVHGNVMGNRFAYNGSTNVVGKNANRNERHWRTITDANGNQTKVERIRQIPADLEADDGMYVRLSDLLYFANKQGWTKGGGKPKSKEHVETQSDLSALSKQIAELTQLMGAFVGLAVEEKTAALKKAIK